MNENDSNTDNNSLSEETKADYMDAFNMFDTNHDGTINSQKIGELMRKLGKNPTDLELKQIIENIAKPGLKQIGFDDFVDLMEQKNKESDPEIEIINKFNENNGIDVKTTIENAFKLFYQMKMNQFIKS